MSTQSDSYRIGVDVGGTNTDAAVINITDTLSPSRGVCASSKTPTTTDVTTGIYTAIEDVLAKSKVNREEVLSVAIGTTHFVNAVVQADAQRLKKVAVVRLCGPFTKQVRSSCHNKGDRLMWLGASLCGISPGPERHYGRASVLPGWR